MRKTINIGDLRLSYLEKNPEAETAILFIHGNSQAATTFHRQFSSEELSAYRLLALDLPGHGLSDRSKTYSIPMMVKAITDFVTKLGLRNFVLAGQSLGGHLALQSLSEVEPGGIFLSATPPLSKPMDASGFRPHPKFGVFYEQHVKNEDLEILLDDLYVSMEERTVGKYEFAQTDPAFRPQLLASIGAGEFQDEVTAFREFSGPKKLIFGREDKLINFESVQNKISDTIIVSGGHNLHLETESYSLELGRFMSLMTPVNRILMSEETVHG